MLLTLRLLQTLHPRRLFERLFIGIAVQLYKYRDSWKRLHLVKHEYAVATGELDDRGYDWTVNARGSFRPRTLFSGPRTLPYHPRL